MKLIKNILVAIDFRESTNNIVQNAIYFAKKFNSKITLFHALPNELENEKVSALVKKAAAGELSKLNEVIENAGLDVGEPILEFGNYSDRIAFSANKTDANLIIIGAGEKLEKDSYKLGTTAGHVIRKSQKPVFVIKQNQNLEHVQRILCPVDFSKESSNALNNAIAMTRLFDAELTVLSVYQKFSYNSVSRISPDEVNAQRKKDKELEIKEFMEKHSTTNLAYTSVVVGGDSANEILKYIKSHDIDLLLMGTTGKSGISKILMGSVAEKVTREVLCSFVMSKKVDFLDFEVKSKDLQENYKAADNLYKNGFYQEAISMYNAALDLNFSHVPSLKGLANAYEQLGEKEQANKYNRMVKDVLKQFEQFKIEEEVRRTMNK